MDSPLWEAEIKPSDKEPVEKHSFHAEKTTSFKDYKSWNQKNEKEVDEDEGVYYDGGGCVGDDEVDVKMLRCVDWYFGVRFWFVTDGQTYEWRTLHW